MTTASAARSQCQEALQRRRLLPLIGERELEEFVERIRRLDPEPREDAAAPALRAEQPGEERERRRLTRHPRAAGEQVRAAAANSGCSHAARSKRVAQACAPVPGEREQEIVVEAEQRALERGREREIVLRQQQRVGERHQVDDGDVLGELEAVGAGDGDPGVLQGTDDRLEQRAALAHQDRARRPG